MTEVLDVGPPKIFSRELQKYLDARVNQEG